MLGVSILWDVETQQARSVLQGHSNYVFCVSFNPMGNIIASGSFDESIKLWDVRSGSSCISTLPAHSDPVCSIDWNKDGTLLASASYDGNLRLWSPDSSVCLKTLIDETHQPVSFVRFTSNGKFLLASTLDSQMRLWDHEKGSAAKTYSGHVNTQYCLFTCFGKTKGSKTLIVGGSEDGSAYIWNLQTKDIVQVLKGHTGPVVAVDHHPKDGKIITSSMEGDPVIKIWTNADAGKPAGAGAGGEGKSEKVSGEKTDKAEKTGVVDDE